MTDVIVQHLLTDEKGYILTVFKITMYCALYMFSSDQV